MPHLSATGYFPDQNPPPDLLSQWVHILVKIKSTWGNRAIERYITYFPTTLMDSTSFPMSEEV